MTAIGEKNILSFIIYAQRKTKETKNKKNKE